MALELPANRARGASSSQRSLNCSGVNNWAGSMCPSNEYCSVEPGKTSRERAILHMRAPLSASSDGIRGTGEKRDAAADLQYLGIALCAVSSLMMGSAATLAFLYLF